MSKSDEFWLINMANTLINRFGLQINHVLKPADHGGGALHPIFFLKTCNSTDHPVFGEIMSMNSKTLGQIVHHAFGPRDITEYRSVRVIEFKSDDMLRFDDVLYGYHPGRKLLGNIALLVLCGAMYEILLTECFILGFCHTFSISHGWYKPKPKLIEFVKETRINKKVLLENNVCPT